ncbi:hypothetical protein [Sulfitobacter sp. AS59]|uniref:hypothetical protein n=1 Tax=Sulfitobacter sp. AS59 TaxID=3135784 RepID=UPI003174E1F8
MKLEKTERIPSEQQTTFAPLTTEAQKSIILGIMLDMADDVDNLFNYFKHIGFDVSVLRNHKDLPNALLGHYRLGQGSYDIDRATMDLATWPPIARRIFELQQEEAKS